MARASDVYLLTPASFQQVSNLEPSALVRVWYRPFVGDFMADAAVRKGKNKRRHTLWAIAGAPEGALMALAAKVAAYLYPAPAALETWRAASVDRSDNP